MMPSGMPSRRSLVLAAVLATAIATPTASASAQRVPRIIVGASAATARFERSGAGPAITGLVVGLDGRVAFRRFALEASYAQGTLSIDGASAREEDVVDGEAMLAFQALSWLTIRGGPHLRAFVTPAGTERWVRWELRAAVETELVPNAMRADAEFGTAVATDVNASAPEAAAQGASVGVTLRVANSPFGLRLAYAVDRATVGNDATEVLQSVGLRLSVGRR